MHNYGTDGAMDMACKKFEKFLSPEERQRYRSTTVEDVFREVKRLRRKQGKLSRSHKFLEQLRPIVEVCGRYATAVDTMVQADPNPGALVWGCMKVLLNVASHHFNYVDSLMAMLLQIGDLLPILKDFEVTLQSSRKFQERLAEVYFDILEFLHKAKLVFSKRGSLVFARNIWKTFQSDFGSTIEKLKRHKQNLDEQIKLIHTMHLEKLVTDVGALVDGMGEIKNRQTEHIEYNLNIQMSSFQQITLDQRVSIMNWVSNSDPAVDFVREASRRVKSSGQWLLRTPAFLDWSTSSDNRILRIVGCPGSGKTVLSTTIVEHLQKPGKEYQDGSSYSYTAFFYCSESEQKQDTASILTSIIKQILAQFDGIPDCVMECFERSRKNGRSTLSVGDNPKRLLKDIARLIGKYSKLYLVIDGLDELSDREGAVDTIREITDSMPNIYTVLLSREISEVTRLSSYPIIKLDSVNMGSDINSYLQEQLDKLQDGDETMVFPPDVYDMLSKKANGMFLWASLMVKSLKDASSLDDALDTIASVPGDLDKFYSLVMTRILENSPPKIQNLARRIIVLMCGASRPLKWAELECMLNTNDELDPQIKVEYKSTILRACSPLIEYLRGTDVFRFAHASVREFFLNANANNSELLETGFVVNEVEAHTAVAGVCLNYLLRTDTGFRRRDEEANSPLLEYASTFWGFHIVRSTYSERLAGKMHDYLSEKSRRMTWIARQLFRESSGFPLQHLIKTQKELHHWDVGDKTATHKDERLDWIQDVGRAMVEIDTADQDPAAEKSQITYFEKLMVIRDLSREYTIRQRLDEAEKWMTDALHQKQQDQGMDHISTVWLLSSLGIIYDQQQRVELSAETHERALAIQERYLGSEHLETVWTINELGRVYRHLGRYDKAVAMHLRALNILKILLPEDDLQIAWTLNTLARAQRKQGSIKDSLECHRQAIEIQTKSLGEDHPHILWATADIGRCYRDLEDLEKSAEFHRKCLEGRKRVLGLDHPDTLWAMNDLGLVLSQSGQVKEAMMLHQQALEGQIKLLGETHAHTVWSRREIDKISIRGSSA
ncbi:hypothetical protein ABW19_dt0206929 [Dactylella cylindrospora]|nr:hypothetical protein ABW19_dt0206929 [Dactylella cylindrospora]